jgi:hypothetical protein
LIDVVTPAELCIISAARSQQFHWNKGAENFRKMNWRVITSKIFQLKQKFMVYCNLLNSSMFFVYILMAVLSVPV